MMIAIPSKGRPTAVKSKRILPSATVFVPESEARDYEHAGVTNVVAVPNHVRGITPTRNWILDNISDRWIVFIDDDVQIQGYLKLEQFRGRHRKLDEAAWIREIVKLFDLTESLKFRIFGVATDGALRSVYPWKPILFRSYVTASFMGIVNDGRTRFDERFTVKEDYELNLRCIKEDGGVVAARYLYWKNSHWKDAGGCAAYRTQLVELRCIKLLAQLYPGMIRRITRGGSSYSIELDF
jgi:glycosyltransferase involved in cell wall biosynthesis